MSKVIIMSVLTAFAVNVQAASPLKCIEKSSYKLSALVKQGSVDKSFLMDTNKVTVQVSAQGAVVVLLAPSLNEQVPNTLTMTFDTSAKMLEAKTRFSAANPSKVIFTKANADEILDVGPEYILDHLKDSVDHPVVADNTKEINFSSANGKINMDIVLTDARVYHIVMDMDGRLLNKGF
jgi:hypothetical protein